MSVLELPAEIDARLDALSKVTGRSKSYHASQAILEYLGDLEDLRLAELEWEEFRSGRSVALPLDDVMKDHCLADRTFDACANESTQLRSADY